MKHTDHEIANAARHFERWADEFDPESDAGGEATSTEDLRAIAEAADALEAAEARLREAVELARAQGRSWNRIAIPLGTSRQAARQRFDPGGSSRAAPAGRAGKAAVVGKAAARRSARRR